LQLPFSNFGYIIFLPLPCFAAPGVDSQRLAQPNNFRQPSQIPVKGLKS
jgi:hypothetical protein